jgi:hypothetical protein
VRFAPNFTGEVATSAPRLREILDSHQFKYVAIDHLPAYIAQETTAVTRIQGKEMAKDIIIDVATASVAGYAIVFTS